MLKFRNIVTLIFFVIVLSLQVVSQTSNPQLERPETKTYDVLPEYSLVYNRPTKPWQIATNLPKDFKEYSQEIFKKKSILRISAIAVSTAALIYYDQDIIDATQKLGAKLNMSADDTRYEKVMGATIFFPKNLNGVLYYLGDGTPHAINNLAFYAYGAIRKDYRALNTALQLTEGLFAVGIATQALKHMTGRQSPYASTQPGGRWDFFPNQIEYMNHVPQYDAFPSGHLATTMVVTTIIAENYPEYKFLAPIGYGCSALLAFAMLNNGAHWASDYPLSIGMGYILGKIISSRGKKQISNNNASSHLLNKKKVNWNFVYSGSLNGSFSGLSVRCSF